jgi:hypothetical protein
MDSFLASHDFVIRTDRQMRCERDTRLQSHFLKLATYLPRSSQPVPQATNSAASCAARCGAAISSTGRTVSWTDTRGRGEREHDQFPTGPFAASPITPL